MRVAIERARQQATFAFTLTSVSFKTVFGPFVLPKEPSSLGLWFTGGGGNSQGSQQSPLPPTPRMIPKFSSGLGVLRKTPELHVHGTSRNACFGPAPDLSAIVRA